MERVGPGVAWNAHVENIILETPDTEPQTIVDHGIIHLHGQLNKTAGSITIICALPRWQFPYPT